MSDARRSTDEATPSEPVLRLIGIVKSFPGVQALKGVDFDIRAGEVHVLLGENGAGKSTLIKILSGVHGPDSGTHLVDGTPVRLPSARRRPDGGDRDDLPGVHARPRS